MSATNTTRLSPSLVKKQPTQAIWLIPSSQKVELQEKPSAAFEMFLSLFWNLESRADNPEPRGKH